MAVALALTPTFRNCAPKVPTFAKISAAWTAGATPIERPAPTARANSVLRSFIELTSALRERFADPRARRLHDSIIIEPPRSAR